MAGKYQKYQDDPVGFAEEVLGVTLTEAQKSLVEVAARSQSTVCRHGHKTGATFGMATLAWWW